MEADALKDLTTIVTLKELRPLSQKISPQIEQSEAAENLCLIPASPSL